MGEPRIMKPGEYDRSKFIGSSSVAAIMSATPEIKGRRYTALDVWLAKTSGAEEELDHETGLFLKRRKRWEGPVVEHLREEFDAEIVHVNRQWVDGDVPYFTAEVDFEWRVDADVAKNLLLPPELVGTIQHGEIKTVSPFAFKEKFGWGEVGTEEIPIHYWIQVQFALSVTRREVAIVAALLGLDQMVFYVIRRNDEDIARMRAECQRFWVDNVLAKVAPEAQTLGDLDRLYKNAVSELSVDGTSTVGSQAMSLRAISGQIEALTLEAERLEFEVKREMKTAEVLVVDGRRVFKWKEQNWARLDQSGLKEKEKAIYKAFTMSGRHRVFTRFRAT